MLLDETSVAGHVQPSHPQGYLVVGSGRVNIQAQSGRTGVRSKIDTPQQICMELWASTGACETKVDISGTTAATEHFPEKQ
jgi:hypothetical protein